MRIVSGASAAVLAACGLTACSSGEQTSPATVTVTVSLPAATTAGNPSPSKPSPTSTKVATATASPAPQAFVLGIGSFGGLKLPATPSAVLAAAKPLLGDPTKKVDGKGCELAGPGRTSVLLQWGDLHAYGEAGPGQTLKIDSWALTGTSTPVPVTLPFGTKLGMTRAALAAALTGETIDTTHMFAEGDIFSASNTWWSLDKANTKVVSITHNPSVCE